jgi:hypothetical protein
MAVNPACGFGLIPDKFIVNTKESLELTDLKNFINVINEQVYALAGQIQVDENTGAVASANIAACLVASQAIIAARAAAPTFYDPTILQLHLGRVAITAAQVSIFISPFANLPAVIAGYDTFRNLALAPPAAGNRGLSGKILKANDMEGLEKALVPLFVAPPPPPATGYPNDERHFKSLGAIPNNLGMVLPARGVNPWPNSAAVPAIIKNVFTWCCSRLKAPGTPNARAPTLLIPAPVNAAGVARFNVYAALANWATTFMGRAPGNISVMRGGTRIHKSTKTGYKKTNSKTASKKKSQIGGVRRKSKKVSKKASKKASKKVSKKASKKASKKTSKKSSKHGSMKGGAKRRGSRKGLKKTSKVKN